MTEETHNAATRGPRGIVMSILVSLVAGWVLLIGVTFAIQNYDAELSSATGVPPAQIFIDAARAARRQAAAADRHRRPAVLRHVLGHRQLPDDLRVLPGRRAARLVALAPGQQADPDAPPTRSGWPRCSRSSSACPTCGTTPPTRRSPRSRSSACTSPTSCPTFLRLRRGEQVPARPVAPGPVEQAGRHDRGDLGGDHHDPVHAAAGRPDHLEDLQLHRVRGCGRHRFRRDLLAGVGAQVVHRPRVQGTPEELAAIEQELAGETYGWRPMDKQRGAVPQAVGAGCSPWSSSAWMAVRATIDTVVVAFTDMQGRLQGKRLSAEYFLDEVVGHVTEGCNYLLAVDVEMNTVDGYAMSSWEQRLRRLRDGAGHVHPAPGAVARGHRDGAGRPGLARRHAGGGLATADSPARRPTGWPSAA